MRSLIRVTFPGSHEDRRPIKDLVEARPLPGITIRVIQSRASAVEDGAIDA